MGLSQFPISFWVGCSKLNFSGNFSISLKFSDKVVPSVSVFSFEYLGVSIVMPPFSFLISFWLCLSLCHHFGQSFVHFIGLLKKKFHSTFVFLSFILLSSCLCTHVDESRWLKQLLSGTIWEKQVHVKVQFPAMCLSCWLAEGQSSGQAGIRTKAGCFGDWETPGGDYQTSPERRLQLPPKDSALLSVILSLFPYQV